MRGEEEVMRCCGKLLFESRQLKKWSWVWTSELETQVSSLDCCKMMHSSFPFPRFLFFYFYVHCSFLACCTSIFVHLISSIISSFYPILLVMLITSINLSLAGRLKVIALASAVGVSAGLITLTVAIMIR